MQILHNNAFANKRFGMVSITYSACGMTSIELVHDRVNKSHVLFVRVFHHNAPPDIRKACTILRTDINMTFVYQMVYILSKMRFICIEMLWSGPSMANRN